MNRLLGRHWRYAGALGAALMLAGCAVGTPRDGWSASPGNAVPAGRVTAGTAGGTAAGEAAVAGTTVTGDGGTAAPAAPLTGTATAPSAGRARGGTVASGGGSAAKSATGGAGSDPVGAAPTGPVAGELGSTIEVAMLAGYDGAYGAIATQIVDNGVATWADDVNANGGIFGRKVHINKVNNHDTAEGGVAACKETVAHGYPIAFIIDGFNGADVTAADCLDKAGVTTLLPTPGGFSSTWHHVYVIALAGNQNAPLVGFIQHRLGDPNPKVGIIYAGDDGQFTSSREGFLAAAKRGSLPVVHEEKVATNQSSYVSELKRMQAAGATTVVPMMGIDVVNVLRDAKAIGFAPHWTGVQWTIDEFSAGARTIMQGIRGLRGFATVDSQSYRDFQAKAKRYGHTAYTGSTSLGAYGEGLSIGAVLQAAGPHITRTGLDAAVESLLNYDNKVNWPFTFGKGVHVARNGEYPVVCCNADGNWTSLGPSGYEF